MTAPQFANLFGERHYGHGNALRSANVLKDMAKATASTLIAFTALKVLPAKGAEAVEAKAAELRAELETNQIDVAQINLDCLQAGLRDLLAEEDAQKVEDNLRNLAEGAAKLHDAIKEILPNLLGGTPS